MIKVWALESLDGEIVAVSKEHQPLFDHVTNDPLAAFLKIREMDYNDDPETEEGIKLKEEVLELLQGVKNFHMNKQAGFYAMHVDDRYRLIKRLLTEEGEPLEFGDSRWSDAPRSKQPSTDLEDL